MIVNQLYLEAVYRQSPSAIGGDKNELSETTGSKRPGPVKCFLNSISSSREQVSRWFFRQPGSDVIQVLIFMKFQ